MTNPRSQKTVLRKQVAIRDDGVCCTCKANDRPWHMDHIIPLSEGGANSLENLQTLCDVCHRAKTALERVRSRKPKHRPLGEYAKGRLWNDSFKLERNRKIAELVRTTDQTYAEIGKEFGIKGERVRQIANVIIAWDTPTADSSSGQDG